jgi:hypothetical protein
MRVKGNNNNEFVDDYILGKLSGSALESFEIAIFNDKTLFDEYKFRNNILNIVKSEGGLIFSEFIHNKSQQSNRFFFPVLLKPAILIPAVIVAIVVAFLISINLFNTPNKQKNNTPFIAQNQNNNNTNDLQTVEDSFTLTEAKNTPNTINNKKPDKSNKPPEPLTNTPIQNNVALVNSITPSNIAFIETTSVTYVWNHDFEDHLVPDIFDNQ